MFGFIFLTLLPLLLAVSYVGIGARTMTFAVMNRVPLKIAPGVGEWAVMSAYCLALWPVALMLWPDLRPALKPMNRRDRDRLAMAREVEYMKDSVSFAAEKHTHAQVMDKLHDQQRSIEDVTHALMLESGTKATKFDPPELRDDEGEIVDDEGPTVALGPEAQELMHKSQAQFDLEGYKEEHDIRTDYDDYFYRRQGCRHRWIAQLIECTVCSPVYTAKNGVKRKVVKDAKSYDHDVSSTF